MSGAPPGGRPQSARDTERAPLVIGLVNNMPDAALQTTERQFRELLDAAAGPSPVAVRLIALANVPRGAAARAELEARYESADVVATGVIDGLIVTGTEPRSARLSDEPYWGALEALIEAAHGQTLSTVWSCLAAHAAVLALDGVERQRYAHKLFGVFECAASAAHPLTEGLRASRRVPHSRFNDVPESALREAGYQILARSDAVGADLFIKEGPSLFVFLQGHPEYDRSALMREYRRDVGRYLGGERDDFPRMPRGYFAREATRRFAAYQASAMERRHPDALREFPALDEGQLPEPLWREGAIQLYANWLTLLRQRRDATLHGALRGGSRARRSESGAPLLAPKANHGP